MSVLGKKKKTESDLEKNKELKNTYMAQMFNKKNSSLKRQGGEMEVHDYLSKLYSSNEIYNCSKESHIVTFQSYEL